MKLEGAKEQEYQLVRTVATVMVIAIHVCAWYILNQTETLQEYKPSAYLLKAFVSNAVPLFVMIMGYFSLRDKTQSSVFLMKKCNRILIPLLVWSTAYSMYTVARLMYAGRDFNVVRTILEGMFLHPYYHLWFMYMAVWLLIFASFVKTYWQRVTSWHTFFIVIVAVLGSVMVGVSGYSSKNSLFQAVMYLGYFFAGSYIGTYVRSSQFSKRFSMLLLFGSMVGYLSVFCGYIAPSTVVQTQVLSSLGGVVATIGMYLLLLRWGKRIGQSAIIEFVDKNSFGVYLVHAVVLDIYMRVGEGRLPLAFGSSALLLEVMIVLILSLGVIEGLRRIGLSKLV